MSLVTYISKEEHNVSWSSLSTNFNISLPALADSDRNPMLLFAAQGYDYDNAGWTFRDSDGTQDTDFIEFYTNAGEGGHDAIYLGYRVGKDTKDKWSGKTLNVQCDGRSIGSIVAMWFTNTRQFPDRNTVIEAKSNPFQPKSTNSAIVSFGEDGYEDDRIISFGANSDLTNLVYNIRTETGGSSNDDHNRAAMAWDNPVDTDSRSYLISIAESGEGNGTRMVCEIYEFVDYGSQGIMVWFDSGFQKVRDKWRLPPWEKKDGLWLPDKRDRIWTPEPVPIPI